MLIKVAYHKVLIYLSGSFAKEVYKLVH